MVSVLFFKEKKKHLFQAYVSEKGKFFRVEVEIRGEIQIMRMQELALAKKSQGLSDHFVITSLAQI